MATTDAVNAAAELTVEEEQARASVGRVIVIGHGFQHLYGNTFTVLVPFISDHFGLGPVASGFISTARQVSQGVSSMAGGVIVDRLQSKRGYLLSISLIIMALGYMLIGFAPNYAVALTALMLGAAAGSFWHPVGLGLLSQFFPKRRGFWVSMHRSGGSIGDAIGPFIVTALLGVVAWQTILRSGFPIIVAMSIAMAVFMWRSGLAGGPPRASTDNDRGFLGQFKAFGALLKKPSLSVLLLTSGLRGMADRTLMWYLPFYMLNNLGMSAWLMGLHISLMTVSSILIGPLVGSWSDRVGRKTVIVTILAGSAVTTSLLSIFSDGIAFSILLFLMGTTMFSVIALIQTAAMDIAEGQKLEGSMVGLLWGNNAVFGAIAPPIAGLLIAWFTPSDSPSYWLIFPFAAILSGLGILGALLLPNTNKEGAERAADAR
jgi:FSR family fosmidomycin resistance protein-like MFS transporter